jgi:hypothetical protein
MADGGDGFLSRWSRRKRQRDAPPEAAPAETPATGATPAPPTAEAPADAGAPPPAAEPALPPPTLDDVAALDPTSDFTRFVARDVDPAVKNAALKKLFADPQFNVMDGLDTYIDDYGQPDPLPPGMLRQMMQSQLLGLFRDEGRTPPPAAAAADNAEAPAAPTDARNPADEDADLQLQPDDAAGPGGPGAGAGQDPGREP